MTVAELIARLRDMPPTATVLFYSPSPRAGVFAIDEALRMDVHTESNPVTGETWCASTPARPYAHNGVVLHPRGAM